MPGEKKEFEEEVAKEIIKAAEEEIGEAQIIKAAEEEYGKAQGEAVGLRNRFPLVLKGKFNDKSR